MTNKEMTATEVLAHWEKLWRPMMTDTPKPAAGQLSAEESHVFVKLYTAMAFGSGIDHAMVGNKRIDFETMTDDQAVMLANYVLSGQDYNNYINNFFNRAFADNRWEVLKGLIDD